MIVIVNYVTLCYSHAQVLTLLASVGAYLFTELRPTNGQYKYWYTA